MRVKQEQARRGLIDFACATHPHYRPAPHHRLIAERLEAIERGEIDRLMIFMPPRHGKSELASCRFPAWYLGRNPDRQVIAASHTMRQARRFGRQVRNLIASSGYGDIFPEAGLSPDSRAADLMHTSRGGAYAAAGAGTAIAGLGAHLLLIDDPVRGQAQAWSPVWREAIDDWYKSDAFTRLMGTSAVVLIQTRWHEDDLAGRLLEREGRVEEGGEWTVLALPAISEAGDPLWPEEYGLERLERARRIVGPRAWSALFQQQPQPEEGTFFRRDWFREWTVLPERLDLYGSSDYAVTDGGGDFTVHQVWGVDSEGNLYRLGGWRGQTSTDVWIARKLGLVSAHKPLAWFGESGKIQKAIEPALNRMMQETKTWCRMEWLPSIDDKPTRALGFQAMLGKGKVFFEPGADISEYLAFPAGRHDDEVDASSLIGRALDMMHPAIVGIGTGTRPLTKEGAWARKWDRAFDEDDDDGPSWMSW